MDEQTQPQQPNVTNSKGSGLQPNISAALSYLLPPLSGIIFFVIEKENKFVRFHAFQAILFGVAFIVANLICGAIPTIGWLLIPVVQLGGLVLGLYLMWKAYNNVEYMLPKLGEIAKQQINK